MGNVTELFVGISVVHSRHVIEGLHTGKNLSFE